MLCCPNFLSASTYCDNDTVATIPNIIIAASELKLTTNVGSLLMPSISFIKEMGKHKFGKLDGIFIVGDVDVGEVDRLKLVAACPYVYAFENSQVADGTVIMGDHIIESGLVIAYLSRGCLDRR